MQQVGMVVDSVEPQSSALVDDPWSDVARLLAKCTDGTTIDIDDEVSLLVAAQTGNHLLAHRMIFKPLCFLSRRNHLKRLIFSKHGI
jgi:hypothetical protein